LLFAPSKTAEAHLGDDGYNGKVIFAGDIMKDMVVNNKKRAKKPTGFELDHFVLGTIHRQSNTDDVETLAQIVEALNTIHQEVPVVMPIHPRTRKVIEREGIDVRFKVIDPVGYLEMLFLLQRAEMVITDSGGLQKEAYYCEKPTIVVRDTSEWLELVEAGFSVLCRPVSKESILQNYKKLKLANPNFNISYYGDGNAAEIIFSGVYQFLTDSKDLLG